MDDSLVSPLSILHICDNFIVVNKPPDTKINSDDPSEITVATILADIYPEKVDKKVAHGFRFVHRLDYATSGCLCVALNKKAASLASKAFQDHTVTKQYLALLRGHLIEQEMEINIAVGEDSKTINTNNRMCVCTSPHCTNPRDAVTSLKLLNHGYYNDNEPVSKVLLTLKTGRRHQLRVHMDHIGHPILGDYTYSDGLDDKPSRMMLHSYKLHVPNGVDVCTDDPFIQGQVI